MHGRTVARARALVLAPALLLGLLGVGAAPAAPPAGTHRPAVAATKGAGKRKGFCKDAKSLSVVWKKYLESADPLAPSALNERVFYSARYLLRMSKEAPASIAPTITAYEQAYETYGNALKSVDYNVAPQSAEQEITIHDALLAFAKAGETQLPPIVAYVKKTCHIDLALTAQSSPPTSSGGGQ